MNVLTLQITAYNFEKILKREQKVETRLCDTATLVKRHYEENVNNGGLDLIKYDALRLINGRKPNAPELTIRVKDYLIEFFENEKGEEITFEINNVETPLTRVCYLLGDIIESKNLEAFNPNNKTLTGTFMTVEEFEGLQ